VISGVRDNGRMSEVLEEGVPGRRAAYGSRSPTVGRRGGKTLDEALLAFGEHGYWDMNIDDLCRRAGVSRATFYQYFESKGDLFYALTSDTGADILRLGERLGPLGPQVEGIVNLNAWLREYQAMYLRHAPVFDVWSEAIFDSPRLRAQAEKFLERYTRALSRSLEALGLDRSYASRLALAVLGTAERISLMGKRAPSAEIDAAFAALTVTVQMMLFPKTSDAFLRKALAIILPPS
jgi:AcrR family transcriptional regulator